MALRRKDTICLATAQIGSEQISIANNLKPTETTRGEKRQMINWITTEQASRIEPIQAGKWLETCNTSNRKVRTTHVDYLVRQILLGNFILTGATIAFDMLGKLVDGQHRLIACVKANKPITSFVVKGLSGEAFSVTDQNIVRRVQDVTDFNQRQVGILNAYNNLIVCNGNRKKSAPQEYQQWYRDMQPHFDSIFSLYTDGKKIGLASVWAALILFSQNDYAKARIFADEFKKPFTSVSQVQVFKNWLLNTDNASGGFQGTVIRKALYAMDAYSKDKTISKVLEMPVDKAFK